MDTQIPPFVTALWNMVEDPKTNEIIHWSENGRYFVICNDMLFTGNVLPLYYKHSNFSSFIRQLNMYGFHKIPNMMPGKIETTKKGTFEFFHPCFQKGAIELLDKIKRKSQSSNKVVVNEGDIKENPQKLDEVYAGITALQNRQIEVDKVLSTLQEENSVLWQELILLRQRHQVQQQIVNKIVQFLVALLQPSSRVGPVVSVKRNPLMIHESSPKKMRKDSSGPTIHELDHSDQPLDDEYIEGGEVQEPAIEFLNELDLPKDNSNSNFELSEIFDESTPSSLPNLNEGNRDAASQENLSSLMNGTYNNIIDRNTTNTPNTSSTPNSLSVATCSNNALKSKSWKDTIDNIDNHVGMTQNELDEIKKIFNGCNSVDTKHLLQLFNEIPSYGLVLNDELLDNIHDTMSDNNKHVSNLLNNVANSPSTEVTHYVPEVIDFNVLLDTLDSGDSNELVQTETLNTPDISTLKPDFFNNTSLE